MRAVVCVAALFGLCRAGSAGSTDIGAPWAGSLIVPAKAEIGSAEPAAPLARIVPMPDAPQVQEPPAASQTTVPRSNTGKRKPVLTGYASYYDFGHITANGERFFPMGMTAAHRTLPFGTRLLVTNKRTGKSVMVRINDRGPFIRGRAIDLARGAARAIGLEGSGLASVTMEVQ